MKITAKVDYACKAMLELSLHWPNKEPLQIAAIARGHIVGGGVRGRWSEAFHARIMPAPAGLPKTRCRPVSFLTSSSFPDRAFYSRTCKSWPTSKRTKRSSPSFLSI